MYKIASKAIANQIRSCLDEVIGEEYSAFIPGRLITDNMLIAHEYVCNEEERQEGMRCVQ